jgi:uncharacterized protein (TIGR02147 family)
MSKKALPVPVFHYYDYRKFLTDLVAHWKKTTYRFSYRKFSRLAGFSAPNMLKQVIDGKRNLTTPSIRRIAAMFQFNKGEEQFFENLVGLNQAKTHAEKKIYYQRLIKAPRYLVVKKEDSNLYAFYSRWYYPVIRELVMVEGFRDDPAWIARQVFPSITTAEAAKAMQVLEETGHLKKTDTGWMQTAPVTSTGPMVQSLAVMNYHRFMIDLAKEALERISHEKRNVTSLTLAVSPTTYKAILHEIGSGHHRL